MNKLFITLSLIALISASSFTTITGNPEGSSRTDNSSLIIPDTVNNRSNFSALTIAAAAELIYDSMALNDEGLDHEAFLLGYKGYRKLEAEGKLSQPGILSICDFSQSSRNKRLYIIDLYNLQLLEHTFVAHGRNTGAEYAKYFSNKSSSHQSSLGFYITMNPYQGGNGLSLRLKGLERGYNDKALARNIVVHGSDYANASFLASNPFLGRSYGCPAVPEKEIGKVVSMIKEGTCFFIYSPNSKYLNDSKILND